MQEVALIDCTRQPGGARVSISACRKMYLKAQRHPMVELFRKRGKSSVPDSLIGTGLAACIGCETGQAYAASASLSQEENNPKASSGAEEGPLEEEIPMQNPNASRTEFRCNQCGQKKRPEEFYRKKDGRIAGYTCQECERERKRVSQAGSANHKARIASGDEVLGACPGPEPAPVSSTGQAQDSIQGSDPGPGNLPQEGLKMEEQTEKQPTGSSPVQAPGSSPGQVLASPARSYRAAIFETRLEEKRARDRASHNATRAERLAPYLAQDGRKRCRACGEVKPVADFRPHKICIDGLWTECEPCRQERQEALRAGTEPRRPLALSRPVAQKGRDVSGPYIGTILDIGAAFGGAVDVLSVPFEERDQALYQKLLALSSRERRHPEQQILRILEAYFIADEAPLPYPVRAEG